MFRGNLRVLRATFRGSTSTFPFVMKLTNAGPSGCAVLRRRSAAARLLRSWVRIPPGAWMSVVSVVCCQVVVSVTG